MTWAEIRRKLSSRKFWALIAIFVPSLLSYAGVLDADKAGELKILIIAGGACVAYMMAETAVDVARILTTETEEKQDDIEESKNNNDEQ